MMMGVREQEVGMGVWGWEHGDGSMGMGAWGWEHGDGNMTIQWDNGVYSCLNMIVVS